MKKRHVVKAVKAMAQGKATKLCQKITLRHVDEVMGIDKFRKFLEETGN